MCVIPVVFFTIVGVRYVNTYSRKQLYLLLLQGVYNDMFRPYIGPKYVVVLNSCNIVTNIVVFD